MASLKEVRKVSRHILAIGAIVIALIFLAILLINIAKSINSSLFPKPPAPPTVSFGKLPSISFPNGNTNKFNYNVDTLSGKLPDFGDRAAVYKMQAAEPSLLALDNAKNLVSKIGYMNDPIRISDTQYMWKNSDPLPKTLVMNIFTNNFIIDSDFLTNSDIQKAANLPDQNGAIDAAISFLNDFGLSPNDIDENKTKATLFSIVNNQLTPATSLSNSQIIRVDFFQNDVNSLPIFYPQATYSTMSMLVGTGDPDAQIVEARFSHQEVTLDNATYPIISPEQALDALKNGEGYIASYDGSDTNITIHNIVLGYYIGDTDQNYLQPIIVFEGDNGFFAYVPAVTSEWIQKQ